HLLTSPSVLNSIYLSIEKSLNCSFSLASISNNFMDDRVIVDTGHGYGFTPINKANSNHFQ
ncbi:MAG TPA: hypothetical protein VE089_07695, partial [Nitrososphaeraceae archaeon]|nr:hypothetical protein [Nitrososphaeraceae archaeon]